MSKARVAAHRFATDQAGIDELKNRCFEEARRFSYFRKGGWAGIRSSIEAAARWKAEHPDWTVTFRAPYLPDRATIREIAREAGVTPTAVREHFTPSREPRTICRRVLCAASVRRTRIREWEAVTCPGNVMTIGASGVGPFSYVVSERMWAVFTRLGADDLRGVMGTDRSTIRFLRDLFDREWVVAALRTG